MFGSGELFQMYRTNFTLMDSFNYDVNFFEDMIPYEREIYLALLLEKLNKEKAKNGNN